MFDKIVGNDLKTLLIFMRTGKRYEWFGDVLLLFGFSLDKILCEVGEKNFHGK